jgi:hypothetical protein
MGLSAYKEVTEWDGEFSKMPQNVYLFDGKNNALAYAKDGDAEIFVFHTPLRIDTRRRKFVKVKHKKLDAFAKTVSVKPKSDYPSWTVKSESGNTYTVELIGDSYQCNCTGFSYRGKCKHSDQIKKENSK